MLLVGRLALLLLLDRRFLLLGRGRRFLSCFLALCLLGSCVSLHGIGNVSVFARTWLALFGNLKEADPFFYSRCVQDELLCSVLIRIIDSGHLR